MTLVENLITLADKNASKVYSSQQVYKPDEIKNLKRE
jgi:hypothetical protein